MFVCVPQGAFKSFNEAGEIIAPTWEVDWSLFGDVGSDSLPIDSLAFNHTFKSFSNETRTFTVVATRLVSLLDDIQFFGGTIGGNVSDGNGDGATLATAGQPLYMSLVDNVDFVPLLVDPSGLTAPPNGSSSFSAPDGIGFPTPLGELLQLGPTLQENIGVRLEFVLSPGNEAQVLGTLGVRQVPEPTSANIALLAVVAASAVWWVKA